MLTVGVHEEKYEDKLTCHENSPIRLPKKKFTERQHL